MAEPIETELKLSADPRAIAALVADPTLFADPTEARQVSTYFDTGDRTLHAAGLSLRVRAIGARRVQTVKAERATAAALFARAEWEREIIDDTPDLADLALAMTEEPPSAVAPLFRTEVDRVKTVVTEGDTRIELVADRGRVVAGAAERPIGEVELELIDGDPRAIFAVARRVAAVAPVRLGVESKSERGYALLDGKPAKAMKAQPLRLDRHMDTAALFAAVAGACVRHFRLNEDRLLATGAPEPLHQARVALRRLRSALAIFRDLLAGPEHDRFRTDLRLLAALLGKVRDIDVVLPRIADAAARTTLKAARAAALEEVTEALDSPRVRTLMLDLAEWTAFGAWRASSAGTAPARDFAADTLDGLRRRLKRRGRRLATLDDEARHEVRIVGKKLRYAAEFFADLFPSPKRGRRRERFLHRLEDMQTALGDLNDLAGAEALLERLGIADGAALIDAGRAAMPRKALLAAAGKGHDAAVDEKRFWR